MDKLLEFVQENYMNTSKLVNDSCVVLFVATSDGY